VTTSIGSASGLETFVYCHVPAHRGPSVTVGCACAGSTPVRRSNAMTCAPVGFPLQATATSVPKPVGLGVVVRVGVNGVTDRRELLVPDGPDGDGGRASGSRTGSFGGKAQPATASNATIETSTPVPAVTGRRPRTPAQSETDPSAVESRTRIAPPDDATLHGAEERQ
jgi:hypothetical protein